MCSLRQNFFYSCCVTLSVPSCISLIQFEHEENEQLANAARIDPNQWKVDGESRCLLRRSEISQIESSIGRIRSDTLGFKCAKREFHAVRLFAARFFVGAAEGRQETGPAPYWLTGAARKGRLAARGSRR